jgi:ATP-dependent DNA helicase RecG
MIIIEGAERFGLAQLHQLRGRVIRSNHQAYCYIFTESNTQKTIDRLQALKTSKNGFELSEHDLQLRGSGELAGNKQWGISDIGMEAIKNIKMVEAAREESNKLITKEFKKKNPLKNFPTLKKKLESKRDIHFE